MHFLTPLKPAKNNNSILIVCLILVTVLAWRLGLFGIGWMADHALEYQPSFPYARQILPTFNVPRFVYSWANFDGVHYLTIVKHGYMGTGLIQAFFPVYPAVIWLGVIVTSYQQAISIGLFLSFIFLCIGSIMWWWATPFFLRSWPEDVTRFRWVSLLLLLVFPTALFFAGLYTESLFLLLSVTSLFLGVKKHFFWAGILAGVASGTKIVGVCLIPALLLELWWPYLRNRVNLRQKCSHLLVTSLVIAVLGSLGILLYAGYLQFAFHDALYFFHVQNQFGAGRQESLVPYPQTAWRSLKILVTARPIDLKYLVYVQEFLVGTLGLLGILLSVKIVRPSVWLFTLLIFLIPTLTGSFLSMPRFALSFYALILGLTYLLYQRRLPLVILILLSTILLIFNTMLFIQGYWVA